MNRDAHTVGAQTVNELRIDSGVCVNDLLMQFQADLLDIPVIRSRRSTTEVARVDSLKLANPVVAVMSECVTTRGLLRSTQMLRVTFLLVDITLKIGVCN